MPDDSWGDWLTQPSRMKNGVGLHRDPNEQYVPAGQQADAEKGYDDAGLHRDPGIPEPGDQGETTRIDHGPTAMDMLTRPVPGGMQDDPGLADALWYPVEGLPGPEDSNAGGPEADVTWL